MATETLHWLFLVRLQKDLVTNYHLILQPRRILILHYRQTKMGFNFQGHVTEEENSNGLHNFGCSCHSHSLRWTHRSMVFHFYCEEMSLHSLLYYWQSRFFPGHFLTVQKYFLGSHNSYYWIYWRKFPRRFHMVNLCWLLSWVFIAIFSKPLKFNLILLFFPFLSFLFVF